MKRWWWVFVLGLVAVAAFLAGVLSRGKGTGGSIGSQILDAQAKYAEKKVRAEVIFADEKKDLDLAVSEPDLRKRRDRIVGLLKDL
jgi:hypothetical protein